MTGEQLGLGALVFFLATLYDLAFAVYAIRAARGQAWSAGGWSVATFLMGFVGYRALFRGSDWYLVPECAGMFVGTVVAVNITRPHD